MQLDLIRQMTEQNVRRLRDDLWGATDDTKGDDARNNGRNGSEALNQKSNGIHKANSETSEKPLSKAAGTPSGIAGAACGEDDSPPREDIDELMRELDGYIGLAGVKREVRSLVNMGKVLRLRRESNLPTADMSLHMVFSGNPGTGKTMIARFMARVYHSIGLLSKGHLVETDRSALVAGYVGQTATKTAAVLNSALGGVLFIDEAYSLSGSSENDFGGECIDTVLKFMEDHRDDIVVIVAGYTDLMEEFIDSNPGLRSRFNKYIEFDDYTAEEMAEIFRFQCLRASYEPTESAMLELNRYFEAAEFSPAQFGNARGVRNTFERVLSAQADRLAALEHVSREELMCLTEADVRCAARVGAPESEE